MSTPAGRRAAATAMGIATALLGGPWQRRGMVRRSAVALGSDRAPRWVGTLVGEVLAAYRDAPRDRPRELAAFVGTTAGWEPGQRATPLPRVVRWPPVGTRWCGTGGACGSSPTSPRWPGCSTSTRASWPGSPTPTGSSAPSPSRCGTTGGRCCSAPAACGCSPPPSRGSRRRSGGRVAWASSVDPVLGARLRALAVRIDWSAPGQVSG